MIVSRRRVLAGLAGVGALPLLAGCPGSQEEDVEEDDVEEVDVDGPSGRFRVVRDEWDNEPGPSDHNPEGLPERTIKEVRLFEAGPVMWPANPDATAGIR